jgi:hypothetical protein
MSTTEASEAQAHAAADAETRRRGQQLADTYRQRIGQPQSPPMTLEEANKLARDAGLPLVMMSVPHRIVLTLDLPAPFDQHRERRLAIPEGVQEMPRAIAEHWFVRAHGVRPYQPPAPQERMYSKEELDQAVAAALATKRKGGGNHE